MQQLSAWAPAMGASTIGCWSLALLLVPTVAATHDAAVMCTIGIFTLLPLTIAIPPAVRARAHTHSPKP